MNTLERRTWFCAVALGLVWFLHVYFDALMFRCIATGVAALVVTVAGVAQAIHRVTS